MIVSCVGLCCVDDCFPWVVCCVGHSLYDIHFHTHVHMHAREEAARRAQLDAEAARRKRLEVLKQIQGMHCGVLIWMGKG